ncbi:MAG: ribosome silencing factor [Acidobacteriota bacterium]
MKTASPSESPSESNAQTGRSGKPEVPDVSARVALAVAAAEDRQAADLRVLDLSEVSGFTDYFMLCSGTNERQVQAIAEAVEGALRSHGVRALHVEGLRASAWVLLDFGSLVVNVFLDESRRYYGLENLWNDAPEVTADFTQAGTAAADGDFPNGD